ncbi:MAG: hypothetical protein ACREP8_05160 [Candidatus Binatia bacterium]
MLKRKPSWYNVERLSPASKQIVDELLGANATYTKIIAELKDRTGEILSVTALQRYWFRVYLPQREATARIRLLTELVETLREIRDAIAQHSPQ